MSYGLINTGHAFAVVFVHAVSRDIVLFTRIDGRQICLPSREAIVPPGEADLPP